MTAYQVTIRDLDNAVLGEFPIDADGIVAAARAVRNALHWRPYSALPRISTAELLPSPMAPGWRASSRQVALFDGTGSEVGRAWVTRADGRPFAAVRR